VLAHGLPNKLVEAISRCTGNAVVPQTLVPLLQSHPRNADMKEIFSSGGGVQSSCIAALIVQGRLPKPDLAIIADTTRERGEVWTYLESVVQPALQEVGVPFYRISTEDYGYAGRNLFNKAGSLLIPAFSTRDAGEGKLKNYCTTYWKIEAIDNFLSREMGIKRQQYRKWIDSLSTKPRATRA